MATQPTPPEDTVSVVLPGPGSPPPGVDGALYDPAENSDGIYDDVAVENHYEFDPNTFMLPITSPAGYAGQKAAFVCLSEPTLATWVADWSVSKRGIAPTVPSEETSDPNVVLLYKYIDPNMLKLMGNGTTVVYRLSGTYVYGFKDSSKAKMYHGRPPWMAKSVGMKLSEKFQKGIISP